MVQFETPRDFPPDRIPELAREFALWYTTPATMRDPIQRKDWEDEHGVQRTLTGSWMRSRWWSELLKETAGSQFGLSSLHDLEVTDALFRKAVSGDASAIKLYLELRRIQTTAPEGESAADLSDDELAQRRQTAKRKLDLEAG